MPEGGDRVFFYSPCSFINVFFIMSRIKKTFRSMNNKLFLVLLCLLLAGNKSNLTSILYPSHAKQIFTKGKHDDGNDVIVVQKM